MSASKSTTTVAASALSVWGERAFRLGGEVFSAQSAALSHDGESLFVAVNERVCEINTSDGSLRRRLRSSVGFVSHLAVADADTLVVSAGDSVRWISLSQDAVIASRERAGFQVLSLAATAARPRACAIGAPSHNYSGSIVWLLDTSASDAASTLVRCELPPARLSVGQGMSYSADGSEVVVVTNRAVFRFDARSGALLATTLDTAAAFGSSVTIVGALRLDDRRLLVATNSPSLALIDLREGTVLVERPFAEENRWFLDGLSLAGPTRSGEVLVSSGGALHVISIDTLEPRASLRDEALLSKPGSPLSVLVDARRDRAFVVDLRGAIHRVDTGASPRIELTPRCGTLRSLWFRGETIVVDRCDSPTERVDSSTGASSYDPFEPSAPSSQTRAPREPTASLFLEGERWTYDETYSYLRGPGCEVYVPKAKGVGWITVAPSKRVAFLSRRGEAIVVDLEARAERGRFKWRGSYGGALVSDADLIVWGDTGVRWLTLAPEGITEVARGPKSYLQNAAVSRDGTRVAAVDSFGRLSIVTRENHWPIEWPEPLGDRCALAWSEDGRRLAVVDRSAAVCVLDVEAAIAASEARAAGGAKAPRRVRRK
ncbi:MAG: PQQ-binding-like beta-propeller repeat protein [Myxococcales bacterium]|nr:PQQ-binding-like beta-propeller repeat protein [Myxococcales bacterium]